MPPKSRGKNNLTEIRCNVPPHTLEDAEAVADQMGLSMGDFHRQAWTRGALAIIAEQNAALENRKLREEP